MSTLNPSNHNQLDPSPEVVRLAAEQTADPATIVTEALTKLPDDPTALYHEHVINAAKAVRRKNPVEYARLAAQATGHKTQLDALTKTELAAMDDNTHDRIIQVVKNHCTLAHDGDGRGVAVIECDALRQVWYVGGQGFEEWLRATYFESHHAGINGSALETAIATISAICKHQGTEVTVHMRATRHGGAYYLDLCDDRWRAIRIDATGWEVVTNPPVLFTRTKPMRPIPEPQRPGALDKLWKHLNVPTDSQLPLLAWLLDAYRDNTPFPILELSGEHGSSKSTTQRRLRDLIDPNKVALRAAPKCVEDLYVVAANNWLVSFENLSFLKGDQQDALCTLATGGGYASRQLYTNGDEHVLETKRPVIINGINAVASQPDLIERIINIEAPTIPPDQRRDEQALEAAWQADYPAVLAGVLDLFAEALRWLPKIKLAKKYRMADYQLLGEALARALGHDEGHFSNLYEKTVSEGVERSLETYGVANAIEVLMDQKEEPWEGTVLALLSRLNLLSDLDRSNWPKSPRGLSGQLKRLAPGLRLHGISIERLPKTQEGAKVRITSSKNRE